MLRKASTRRVVLISALGCAFGYSVVQAQTPAPSIIFSAETQSSGVDLDKKTTRKNALVAGVSVASLRGSNVFTSINGQETPPVVNAPISAVLKREDVTKLVDGNRIVRTNTTKMYRDSQGRTRVEHYAGPMPGMQRDFPAMINVADPLTGESFMLNTQQKTAHMYPASGPSPLVQAPVETPPIRPNVSLPILGFAFGGMMGQSPSKETSLGEKSIDGVRAVGTRVEYTMAANTIGSDKPITMQFEQWFSPELGLVLLSTQRSTAGIESTSTLELISREEPDRSLFTVPADFTKEDMSQRFMQFRSLQAEPAPK